VQTVRTEALRGTLYETLARAAGGLKSARSSPHRSWLLQHFAWLETEMSPALHLRATTIYDGHQLGEELLSVELQSPSLEVALAAPPTSARFSPAHGASAVLEAVHTVPPTSARSALSPLSHPPCIAACAIEHTRHGRCYATSRHLAPSDARCQAACSRRH
jgi:hypothetical protein